MENLKGHIISYLPISGLRKVSDFLEHEGPILSHFVDKSNRNYLYYWVDFDGDYNRWLIWKVSFKKLIEYLKGHVSLKELMCEPNKDFIFSADLDRKLEFNNVIAIDIEDLPLAYIPEEDSFYTLPIPNLYLQLSEDRHENSYLELLKEKALYFTLEPNLPTFSTTVSAISASGFLKKISNSFLNFMEEDFFKTYRETITDFSRLKKIISQFKEILEPRVVYLQYSSFKVGLSTDSIKTLDQVSSYKEWQKSILDKYRNEVIDVNYNSEEELRNINKNYSEEARRKIFSPIIEILNDKDYHLTVTDQKHRFKRSFVGKISKEKQDILLPPKIEEETFEKKKLYSIVIEATEGEDFTKIKGKALQTGLLFSQELEKVEYPLNYAISLGHRLKFKNQIKFWYYIDSQNLYHAESEEFGIFIVAYSKEQIIKMFQDELIHLYLSNNTKRDKDSLRLMENFNKYLESHSVNSDDEDFPF
ncbi:hypothetical protein SAMN05518672_113144 [Chitinophaga sp. CF118]|uniref:DUF6575 domain-containing protein n=1 Tax=Chitinophaga sp. CF118 TaxID=1884367 RepID=UPI0008F06E22|nr:DUF6575 domain-containing protein [Chitinophaga sp. CF118]SFE98218.1 hypothetical protein SAMN05518672_113144 [Chitinophaga sp. CF118]